MAIKMYNRIKNQSIEKKIDNVIKKLIKAISIK